MFFLTTCPSNLFLSHGFFIPKTQVSCLFPSCCKKESDGLFHNKTGCELSSFTGKSAQAEWPGLVPLCVPKQPHNFGQIILLCCLVFSPVFSEDIPLKFFSDLVSLESTIKLYITVFKGCERRQWGQNCSGHPRVAAITCFCLEKPWDFSGQLSSDFSWQLWPSVMPAPPGQLPAGGYT